MPPDEMARRRPSRADACTAAADHDTAFVTVGGPTWRVSAEVHLREAGRLIEWAAVTDPDLSREAKIIFLAANRVRSHRMSRVAA